MTDDRIVSGIYRHYQGTTRTETQESWSLVRVDDRLSRLQVVYQHADTRITADMTLDHDRCTRLSYAVTTAVGQIAEGEIAVLERRITAERVLHRVTRLADTIPYTGTLVFDPPFVSSKGYAIRQLAGTVQKSVFAPHLTAGDRAGDLAKKSARFIADTRLEIDGKQFQTKRYHYMRDYWVDEHSFVLQARDDAHDYAIVLTEYQRTT
jgi:hypothetical protein